MGTEKTSDLHIQSVTPLIAPKLLKVEFPMTDASRQTIIESRKTIADIISGKDERMLAVVGPCSIHDPAAGIEYAHRLNELRKRVDDTLYVVMRVYFEKPRTRLGWRGLILDPRMDGSRDIREGLGVARKILLEITGMGMPTGSEMLDPIVPQYIDDLVSWASIGARTTESQTHRELASGLSMPVGFKNGTDGSIETAVNALASSMESHSFIGIDQDGRTCVLNTTGNRNGHIILRGGNDGPNYHDENVEDAIAMLRQADLSESIMIDCSHANSRRDHRRQEKVLRSVIRQRVEGNRSLIGFMVESNIHEGRQGIPQNLAELMYGVSVTDACISWEKTEELLLDAHGALSGVITPPERSAQPV
ncbi:MAG TPA: 3-deoxy-7-phosphoheptulonate synthase [Spirochaetia bacterium]|nr:3-deoxy-7-phosphoheptulonate synthase [Spirochaetia bacterium]